MTFMKRIPGFNKHSFWLNVNLFVWLFWTYVYLPLIKRGTALLLGASLMSLTHFLIYLFKKLIFSPKMCPLYSYYQIHSCEARQKVFLIS